MKAKDIQVLYDVWDEPTLHYLTHIGKINGPQDYENKKHVLGNLCKNGELKGSIASLDTIKWVEC